MNIRNTLAIAACALGLLACARDTGYHPPEALPPPNLQADAGKAGITTVRVLLRFKPAAAGSTAQAFDDENFVTALQVQAQVPMHYIAAVSADTHVYGLELPGTQDAALAVQRLQALASVARVELDDKKAKAK